MNLNEYKVSLLFKSPSSSSHSFILNTEKLKMFTYFTYQIFGVVDPLGENLDFFVPWDFTFNQILTTKSKDQALLSQSFKTLFDEKSLIHGNKFSSQMFEKYYETIN